MVTVLNFFFPTPSTEGRYIFSRRAIVIRDLHAWAHCTVYYYYFFRYTLNPHFSSPPVSHEISLAAHTYLRINAFSCTLYIAANAGVAECWNRTGSERWGIARVYMYTHIHIVYYSWCVRVRRIIRTGEVHCTYARERKNRTSSDRGAKATPKRFAFW